MMSAPSSPSPVLLDPLPPHALPWRLLLPILLFGTYPLALFFGVGVPFTPGLVFHLALPSFALLSLATVPYVLGCGYGTSGGRGRFLAAWLPIGLVGYAGVVMVSAALGRSVRVDEMVGVLGLVYLPVFFAVAPRRFLPRRLPGLLAWLWAVNVCHSLVQVAVGFEVVALAGNRNWAAATLVCLVPWVWLGAGGLPLVWRRLAVVASTGLTGWLVWLCRSRAVLLVVVVYLVWFVLLRRLPGRWRIAALGMGTLLILLGGLLFRDRVAAAVAEDIRLPLYAGTLQLVAERPILGVGPGNFRREYAGRRSTAHLSRRVTAAVTEHPHNELLRVAAELGAPAALAWAALVGFALFGIGPGRRPSQRVCHFSAFALVGHGMLDKPLVMPPTSLLAMLFVGLLLRWHVPARLVAASGRRLAVQAVLAVLVVALGGYLTLVVTWQGSLVRSGFLAEEGGDGERAYAAFAAAAAIAPWDVRSHMYAGIHANRQQNPEQALVHFVRVQELEPDFAHLNGEVGRALGRLGRHREALPFFFRETERFPFHPGGWRDLFVCGLRTGGMVDLLWVQDQLCSLRLRRVRELLATPEADGETVARRLAAAFALAAEGGEPGQEEEALAWATRLAVDLRLPGVEGIRPSGDPQRYGPEDVRFWQARLKWRNAWLHCREDASALLAAWRRLPPVWQRVGFVEFAESAGWRALVVETVPETVELQRAGESVLVVPSGRGLEVGTIEELIADDALQGRLGVRFPGERVAVRLVFGELRLYERTQHLAYVLHRLLPDTMPDLYRSPYALLHAVQRRFGEAGLAVHVNVQAVPE